MTPEQLAKIRERDAEFDPLSSHLGEGVMFGESDRRALLAYVNELRDQLQASQCAEKMSADIVKGLRDQLQTSQFIVNDQRETMERNFESFARMRGDLGVCEATIESLCDRLDKINQIAHETASQERPALERIRDLSGGFMPLPKEEA